MIELLNVSVSGWDAAIRGMRNPLNSWDRSDSNLAFEMDGYGPDIGPNDLILMWRLARAGSDHGKFMRFITVSMDINAPLYWWKEFDTYKVGTVANSCSTMHTITNQRFNADMFSLEDLDEDAAIVADILINALNTYRIKYLRYEKLAKGDQSYDILAKEAWRNIIQLLPSSWNQLRTVILNYEVLRRMYSARRYHKLSEWREFCARIEKLPYSFLITGDSTEYEQVLNEIQTFEGADE